MLRIHRAMHNGNLVLMVTSTKEKITATIEVDLHTSEGASKLLFPDFSEQALIFTDIESVGDVESVQTRENRKAAQEKRTAVKFPPNMAQRSIPVMPVDREEAHAHVPG